MFNNINSVTINFINKIPVPSPNKRPVRSWPGHEWTRRSKKRDNLVYVTWRISKLVYRHIFRGWLSYLGMFRRSIRNPIHQFLRKFPLGTGEGLCQYRKNRVCDTHGCRLWKSWPPQTGADQIRKKIRILAMHTTLGLTPPPYTHTHTPNCIIRAYTYVFSCFAIKRQNSNIIFILQPVDGQSFMSFSSDLVLTIDEIRSALNENVNNDNSKINRMLYNKITSE